MQLTAVRLRHFRSYAAAELPLGRGLTVLAGVNGAGKTNLLEAVYFGCTGRSCRTSNEREVVHFGADAARVEVALLDADGAHELSVGFRPGEPKRMQVDGAPVERLLDSPHRPLVSVFLPDRLELVKGSPALRRSHLDQFVSALWPARAATRRAYAQALAQRNALIARIRSGYSGREQLPGWDLQLARHAIALMQDRAAAVELIAPRFAKLGALLELGEEHELELAYRPRSPAMGAEEFVGELAERLDRDVERGYTAHGPHRDDLSLLRGRRELRTYGSQGQQRLALLALLLAEREALTEARDSVPLLLLDDVMSELDSVRRGALVALLQSQSGQVLITATDAEHVPLDGRSAPARMEVVDGRISAPLATREPVVVPAG